MPENHRTDAQLPTYNGGRVKNMATVWDVTDGFDAVVVDTQGTRVRPNTKVGYFSVIAVAIGAMFSSPEPRVVVVEDAWVSSPVIGVSTVLRTDVGARKKSVRRER